MLRLPVKSAEFQQLQRWLWYEAVEPFGELREDWRTAKLEAMAHNIAVSEENQRDPIHFLLKFQDDRPKQTVDEQIMILNILAVAQAAAMKG